MKNRSLHLKRTLTGVIAGGAMLATTTVAPAAAQPAVFANPVPLAAVQTDDENIGNDGVLDQNDAGYLGQDLDGDGINEIGIDENQSGTLEDNEVYGSDLNNDQALTEDESDRGFTTDFGSTPVADAAATPAIEHLGVFGDDERFDASDPGFVREDLNGDGVFEIGYDANQSGTLDNNEIYGSDLDNDEGLGTPLTDSGTIGAEDPAGVDTEDFTTAAGEDGTFDANDEGYLSGDVDDDGTFEIGVDQDASDTLEENEVLGTDLNNDEALTEDEVIAEASGETAGEMTSSDFVNYAGDDNSFDANDAGYLSGDADGDGTTDIGFDEDQSGTLEENEVVGTDLNSDGALTEDEFGA